MSPGGACQQAATATLLGTVGAAAILPLGDNQYECGELSNFQSFYGPTWGQFKNVTYPVVGNHEYLTAGGPTPCLSNQTQPGAPGYFTYFGSAASPMDASCSVACRGYYSFDVGAWHLIALNANCGAVGVGGCGAGSPEETWLRADLAAHANRCTLAYWHQPRFTSGQEGDTIGLQAFWSDLYDAQVDLVLNGHDHDYERFAQLGKVSTTDSAGLEQPVVDPNGIREIVVGTGGRNLTRFPAGFKTGSQVHDASTFGVLKLDLHASSYGWTFLPAGTGTFTDSGSTSCRYNAPIDSTPPTSPGGLQVIASQTAADLSWTAATDNVGVAAYRISRNATPLMTIPTANLAYTDTAVVTGQTYTYTVAAVDAAGNVSATSASVTVTIPAGSGSLAGIVANSSSGAPISGATVSDSAGSVVTDSSGHYSQTVPAATYMVTATASGFGPVSASVTVASGGSATQNFALSPGGCITGFVIDSNGIAPLSGATVSWLGGTTKTDAAGNYTLAGLSDGSYSVTATQPGFTPQTRPVVTVAGGNCPTAGFSLNPDIFSDGFESGTFSAWNGGSANNTIVEATTLHSGGDAAEANVSNLAYSATRTLPSTYPVVYVRTYFRLHSKSTNVGIYRVRTAGAIDILHLYVDNATGQLGLRNDVTGVAMLSGHVVTVDTWHSIETKVIINGTSSTIQVWLYGTDQTALDSTTTNLGTANVGQVTIGDTNPRTADAFWDDVAVADGRIGG